MKRLARIQVLIFLALCVSINIVHSYDVKAIPNCPQSLTREFLSGQGCCSWHGGECGCQGGRVVYCDGSYSPTCTCDKDIQVSNWIYAWNGYDDQKLTEVEIETGTIVKGGKTIDFFDYGDNSYHNADIISINRLGSKVFINTYDYNIRQYRTLDMYDY